VRAEDWIITEQDYSHVRRGIAPREEQAEGLLRKSLEAFESMPRSLAYNITHGNEIRAWLSADKE
jgi:DNA recombination-dependent growth factor C